MDFPIAKVRNKFVPLSFPFLDRLPNHMASSPLPGIRTAIKTWPYYCQLRQSRRNRHVGIFKVIHSEWVAG